MKYLLLVHHNQVAFGQFSETTRKEMLAESVRLTHQLHADGQCLSASLLHPTSTAARVQLRDGKRLETDGPFSRQTLHPEIHPANVEAYRDDSPRLYRICRHFGTCRMDGRLPLAPCVLPYHKPDQDRSFALCLHPRRLASCKTAAGI